MRIFGVALSVLPNARLLYKTTAFPPLPFGKDASKRKSLLQNIFVRNMAGHSKWQNIRHIKAKNDAIKAVAFNRHCLEIRKAVLSDGPDPKLNSKLAAAIKNARKVNMPNATIDNAIKKAVNVQMKLGEIEVVGPGGCLLLLELESENIDRTIHSIRLLLKKNKLGLLSKEKRSRMQFESKVIVRVTGKKDGSKLDLENATDDAILANAEDVQENADEDGNPLLVFLGSQEDYGKIKKWFDESNYVVQDIGIEYVAINPMDLSEDDLERASQLCSQLEELNEVVKINVNIS